MSHLPHPFAANDPSLLHNSIRTAVSTNRTADDKKVVGVNITRLEIRWLDGEIAMRFSASAMEVPEQRSDRRR